MPLPPSTPDPVDPIATTDPATPDGVALGPAGIGLVWAGGTTTTPSSAPPDAPTTEVIPPTSGTPVPMAPAPFGTVPSAESLLPLLVQPSTNLLARTVGSLSSVFPDGSTISCSAVVINSATDDIVLTAAQCIHDVTTEQDATQLVFTPNREITPTLGVWAATDWIVSPSFLASATLDGESSIGDGWANDFAFVRVEQNATGQSLESVTGGQGIAFAGETGPAVSLAIPVVAPFDGYEVQFCATDNPGFGNHYWPHFTMPCNMTGGMAGGPWTTAIDASTGAGYVVAVNSTIPAGGATAAPLGAEALDILTQLEQR